MSEIKIEFPHDDAKRMFNQIERAQKELGKGLKESVQWAGILLMQSLAKSTRVSKKTRPIIKRPTWDKNYRKAKKDGRYAPFGVKRWDKDGKRFFMPIYRTGEFGKLRFFDKKTVAWYDRSGGAGKWRKIQSGQDIANPEIIVPGIKTDKRRIIGRRGLAKKAWQWARSNVRRGGSGNILGVRNIVDSGWTGGTVNPTLTIRNRIRYLDKATRGGLNQVNTAMGRAARGMANRIDDEIKKKMGAA